MPDQWHYSRDGAKRGPINAKQLRSLADKGQLRPTDHVWKAGMKEPVPASRVKGLFPTITDEEEGIAPSPPVAPVSQPESDPVVEPDADPFGFDALADVVDTSLPISPPRLLDGVIASDAAASGENSGNQTGTEALHSRTAPTIAVGSPDSTVPLSEIPDRFRSYVNAGENVLYASNPSRNARSLSMVVCGVLAAIPFLPVMFAGLIGAGWLSAVIGFALCVIAAATAAFIAHMKWKNQFYIITDSRTIVSQGIFNIAVRIVFNHNIQMIAVNTGVIDRRLDLNSIQLSTSGSGGGLPIFAFFPGMSPGNIQLRWVADAPSVVGLISA